jgi:hypothetical protein
VAEVPVVAAAEAEEVFATCLVPSEFVLLASLRASPSSASLLND